jgi:hypothetical protein
LEEVFYFLFMLYSNGLFYLISPNHHED